MNNNEYTFLGKNIETVSIYYGLFLIFWGFIISMLSNSESMTSFIPSLLGAPIFILSYLSIKFTQRKKLLMHIVVTFGLITFIGGLDFLRNILSSNFFTNFWADISKLMMMFTGLFFVILCAQSFIYARKNKIEISKK